MPWVSLDARFAEHGKNDQLSDAAFRLLISAICHCNLTETDGLVNRDRVPRLVPKFRPGALRELVDRGRVIPIGSDPNKPDAYLIHDYLDWNLSKAQLEERRQKKRDAGKKGADTRWG